MLERGDRPPNGRPVECATSSSRSPRRAACWPSRRAGGAASACSTTRRRARMGIRATRTGWRSRFTLPFDGRPRPRAGRPVARRPRLHHRRHERLRRVPARRAEDAARPGGAAVGVGAEAAVDVLLRAMGLPEEVREAARAVRRRRDGAGEAGRVIGWFEGVGGRATRTRRFPGKLVAFVRGH